MREILFRGKRIDSGEWIYGYLIADTADCSLKRQGKCRCPHDGSYAEIYEWQNDLHEYNGEEVVPATVGQYTGLTDKNGKRIFEGDIVKDTKTNVAYCVTFPSGSFQIENPKNEWDVDLLYPLVGAGRCEIIGNTHDNPELLDGVAT